jgi:MATE family multidrug resistance protein
VQFLGIAAVFQLADAAQAIAAGGLRGLKDTRVPLLLATVAYWGCGFTAAALLGLGLGHGGIGVWSGLALGLAVAAVLLGARFVRRARAAAAPAG